MEGEYGHYDDIDRHQREEKTERMTETATERVTSRQEEGQGKEGKLGVTSQECEMKKERAGNLVGNEKKQQLRCRQSAHMERTRKRNCRLGVTARGYAMEVHSLEWAGKETMHSNTPCVLPL